MMLLGLGLAIFATWIVMSHGTIDPQGRPLGTDFSSFYAAGSMVLDGQAGEVYTASAHFARQQQIFGANTPYYAWLYPPVFLLLATPLALLPYLLALALWQAGSFAFYLLVIRGIVRQASLDSPVIAALWLPAAAAFPAVFINLGHGQNGFLTAGLLGAALLALDRRPALAGALFALLCYKPQFALVIPLALLAAGAWRAILAGLVATLMLVGLSSLAFGIDVWPAFLASTASAQKLLLEQGEVGFAKLQSVFAVIRMWGGSVALAYALQGAVTLLVMCSVAWAWRAPRDRNASAALLMIGTLLASPHVLDYDLVVLGPAITFAVCAGIARGFRPFEISVLAMAWAVPLLTRTIATATMIPTGLLVLFALYALTMMRVSLQRKTSIAARERVAQI